uniref:Ethylmalonyl-CoA/methylmalonyl-CoA decarboxylase n=1 Tax=Rhipicephalus appendiculatus TaxID=34631 RepID=A0A131Z2J3_RHIAP
MKYASLLLSRLFVKNVPGYRRLTTLSDELRSKFSAFKGGTVELTKDDRTGIAEVHFSNPTKRNSFSGHMMVQLHDVVRELHSWKEGGGAELTTACDFRVMVPGSEIQFVQVRMGLVPGWGGTTRLVRLLGAHEALELLASSRKVGAEEAHEIGLVDYVLQNYESPLAEAKNWLGQYIAGDAHVIRTLKETIVKARELSTVDSLREELRLFSTVWSGPANREALKKKLKH